MTPYMATRIWVNTDSDNVLFAWRHQAITWTKIDNSSARSNYINLREISRMSRQSLI